MCVHRVTGRLILMGIKRIHVGFTASQVRVLEKLAAKLGLDKTNAIRYCVARIAEIEKVVVARGERNS